MPTANPGSAAIYCPKARCQSLKHRRFPSFLVFFIIPQITPLYKYEFRHVTLARLGPIGYIPRSSTWANVPASTPAERCRSGRTGRSRKPLCACVPRVRIPVSPPFSPLRTLGPHRAFEFCYLTRQCRFSSTCAQLMCRLIRWDRVLRCYH